MRQPVNSYYFFEDQPSNAVNDQPGSPIDSLQPINTPDPVHRTLESEVESISDTLMRVDGQLYHTNCDPDKLRSYFLSIAQRAHRCANLVKAQTDG